ncbi:MAG: hypothetical protein K9M82_04195 [Deltaproteobacteria bacterium]|nr:hypothetical protein [Deltaproteobacteria bacterium]
MQNRCMHRLVPLLLAALVLAATGCGTARNLVRKVTPGGEGTELKKRVLILPILDQQGLAEETVEEMTGRLATLLERNRSLVVYRNEDPLPGGIQVRSPKFGIVIDPDMAQKAEEMGMNVLVTCVLNRYELIDHGAGVWPVNKIPVWPFSQKKLEVEVSMVVNALDITNGTLFLTHIEARRLAVPEEKMDEDALFVKEGEPRSEAELIQAVPEKAIQKAFADILEDQAETIAESLEDKAWAGRVLSAAPERIMINAGRDVGLSEGSVFEVYGRGESIRSVSGRSLYLLGPKVGEIRTVKVMDRYSSAVPVSGESFRAGQVIREKQ